MAKIQAIEFRLLNWALWKERGGGGRLGFARADLTDIRAASGYREAVIPIDDCEASQTDVAVESLQPRLKNTIVEHYLGRSTDVRSQASTLGCSVATLYSRIDDAHRLIAAWFTDKREAAERERDRVERLQGHLRVKRQMGSLG